MSAYDSARFVPSSDKKNKFVHESVVTCYRTISYNKKRREQQKPNYRHGFTAYRKSIDPLESPVDDEEVPPTDHGSVSVADVVEEEEDARYSEFEWPRQI